MRPILLSWLWYCYPCTTRPRITGKQCLGVDTESQTSINGWCPGVGVFYIRLVVWLWMLTQLWTWWKNGEWPPGRLYRLFYQEIDVVEWINVCLPILNEETASQGHYCQNGDGEQGTIGRAYIPTLWIDKDNGNSYTLNSICLWIQDSQVYIWI